MKYWNKTINLLLKTNNFYKLAKKIGLFSNAQSVNEFGGWSSEDDSPDSESPISEIPESVGKPGEDLGTFHNLKKLANTIDNKNPDVANQIEIIAELLKKAIRSNKGYSYVMNALSNFVSDTLPDNYPEDEDDDEEDDVDESKLNAIQREVRRAKQERLEIEMMMNKTASDIRKRALSANVDIRKPDSPEVTKEMRLAKLDFEGVLEQKERNLRDNREPGIIDPNEKQTAEELKGMGIDVEDSSSEKSDIENELGFSSEIDKSDIAGKREREGGGLPGMGVRTIHNYKDYIEFYNEEISKYNDILSDTEDAASKKNLTELLNTLSKLKTNHKNLEELSKDISWTVHPATEFSPKQKIIDQPELKNQYDQLKIEQRNLGKRRSELIQKIKNYRLKKANEQLQQRFESTRSEKEKFLIKQLILLNDVKSSTDVGRSEEIRLRKRLINVLTGGNSLEKIEENPELYLTGLSQSYIDSMLEKIKQASLLRKTKKEINLEQTIKNKELIQSGRAFGDISGLIKELTQHIPNIKMGDKKTFFLRESERIITEATEEESSLYKPYIDVIIAARKTNNKPSQAAAIKQLAAALNNVQEKFTKLKEQMETFDADHQDITFWRKSLQASDKKNLFKKDNLSNEDRNEFKTLILTGERLLDSAVLRQSSITIINNLVRSLTDRYNHIVQTRISNQNKVRVENISPDTGEVTIEEMNETDAFNLEPSPLRRIIRDKMSAKRRKNILRKIANESFQNKMTDNIMNNNSLESITDPEEYAHEVFQEMLKIIQNNNKLD